jgi:hypothetical protein
VVEELVDVQRIARREDNVLVWSRGDRPAIAASPSRIPNTLPPRHLADKIFQSKSAPEGERK